MLLRVGMWVWLIILVAELVVGPPLAMEVRVCLEANDFPTTLRKSAENLTCTGTCWLAASDVQIIYWPTDWPMESDNPSANATLTTILPASSGLVLDSMTFVMPSVYVAYHNLEAYVSCPSGAPLARGRSYNTTVAYAPEELSTALSARSQETDCTYVTVNYTMLGDYSSSGDPDFFLSIPSSLTTLDPAWSTCTPVLYGAWDPPSTLSTATALTSSAQETVQLQFATPVGRPTPAYAPATTVTAAGDPVNSNSWDQPMPVAPRMSSLSRTDAEEAPEPSLIGMSSLIIASSRGPTMVALPLLAGKSITWDPNDGLIFADSTIAFGGQATISGHAISLGTSDAVIDSSTYALSVHTAEDKSLPLITLPDGTFTSYMNGPDEVKIGSRTIIVQDSAITISGTAISLGSSGLYIDPSLLPLTYSTKNLNTSLDGPPVSKSYDESNSVGSGNSSSSKGVFTSRSQRSVGLSLINTSISTITMAITVALVLAL